MLDAQLAAQIAERGDDIEGVELVWSGTDVEDFARRAHTLTPDVIAVELGLLGSEPARRVERLAEETGAQMVVVLYAFATRGLVADLSATAAKTLRSPVSLDSLRGLCSGLLVRKILNADTPGAPPSSRPGRSRRGVSAPPAASAPRASSATELVPKYDVAQLGRLKEIESAIECECPAHVADLLTQLAAFETYSANCASRNEADRLIHQMLHDQTKRARIVMESALEKLLEHEGIEI